MTYSVALSYPDHILGGEGLKNSEGLATRTKVAIRTFISFNCLILRRLPGYMCFEDVATASCAAAPVVEADKNSYCAVCVCVCVSLSLCNVKSLRETWKSVGVGKWVGVGGQ